MVTPLGGTAAETASAWRSGATARRRPPPSLAGSPFEQLAIPVLPEIDAAARLGGRRMLKFMSSASLLGCVAAREALEDAGAQGRFRGEEIGIFSGVGTAPIELDDIAGMVAGSVDELGRFSCKLFGERGLFSANPLVAFRILPNMPPCLISIIEGIKGPSYVFAPGEGQTGGAFLEAWNSVAAGELEGALVGAADTPAHPSVFPLLREAGVLSEGDVPSSGAAYVFLERLETAGTAPRIHARLPRVEVFPSPGSPRDPLAPRMGRTVAAAPAILIGVTALTGGGRVSVRGADEQEVLFELEAV